MSNKEILQNNNTRLDDNNVDLNGILNTINSLSEKIKINSQDKIEDLTDELTEQDNLLITQDTATSTSFCVFTIDRKNRKIHAICYGAGIDRELDY